ncbi:hypothetical protein [Pseudoxanthomonas winnipegensis]|uniref:Glycoside hydrolase family 5 domain-containing protein n=1 Tax=Pseudoxanthomonas winnipegensis TaxID=2480810 RepID=A0A4Q8LTR3_9GAMM|nr:hypothetical protein [Pseudoxanthomonas winnipegensis]RZZ83015.1 hypothetical protein EA663_17710 [Pseudoxanthomonas winnipegensis]TAA35357.1 hypothetical protein EA656_06545 [Pseudoxanthomonas winnipegensis]
MAGLLLAAGASGGLEDTQTSAENFYRFEAAPAAPGSLVDFSYLNRPLTAGDRLRACGEALCTQEGATPVRLFGVNVGFEAALRDADEAERLVTDLRALGVNLIRLHALDAIADGERVDGLLTGDPFPTLDPVAIQRLRGLLERCRQAGIYVDLNLHVRYAFRPSIDGTLAVDDEPEWPNQSKPLLRIDPAAARLQARYAQALLTALQGAGEPALAIVEIDNESSLVYAWMDGSLARVVQGAPLKVFLDVWRQWLQTHGAGHDIDASQLPRLDDADETTAALFLEFLADQDAGYNTRIAQAIAGAAPAALTIGTQMNFSGLGGMRALAGMDLRDGHFYVDHYRFPGTQWQWDDWRIGDTSALAQGLAPLLGAAFYRVYGAPFLITEFNQPWPNRNAAEILPETAVLASLQGWAGLAYYDYAHRRGSQTPTVPYEFSLSGDGGRRAQFGQMAWLFRTGAIGPLSTAFGYTPDAGLQLRATRGRITTLLGDFLHAQGVASADWALDRRVGIGTSTAQNTASVRGSEVAVDPRHATLLVAAPRVAGIVGRLQPGQRYASGPLSVEMAHAGMTALMLSAQDGEAIALSSRLLLTLPGYTLGSDAHGSPVDLVPASWLGQAGPAIGAATGDYTLHDPQHGGGQNLREIRAPIWMRRQPCVVGLTLPALQLTVYPLDARGNRLPPLAGDAVRKTSTGFELHLQSPDQAAAPWYELQASP